MPFTIIRSVIFFEFEVGFRFDETLQYTIFFIFMSYLPYLKYVLYAYLRACGTLVGFRFETQLVCLTHVKKRTPDWGYVDYTYGPIRSR